MLKIFQVLQSYCLVKTSDTIYYFIIAIMANNNPETFNQLYEVFLYKKKDIIAIQEKLSISDNANRTAVHQSKKVKTLADLYELLLELVGNLIPIRDD